MPSILAPRWLRPQIFYPHWMGGTTVVGISVYGMGYDLKPDPELHETKKITLLLTSVKISQGDYVQEVKPNFEYKEIAKHKQFPSVIVDDINFIQDD